ncbi:8184_t:CDS:10 [Entrophospora sp. SA101]|nr:8184_t:CDS:10 [Entrophospora sp. SA101]CAJ0917327.1 21459_t:CDS:10 [Entrophospora sp. SA101]
MYNYVVTAHKSSSVIDSVKGKFCTTGEINLFVNKITHIEIYTLIPGGLKLLQDVPIYGRIACMGIYRPARCDTDLLFVTTENLDYFVLSYDQTTQKVKTECYGNFNAKKSKRPSEPGQLLAIDEKSRMIAVQSCEGTLNVFPIMNDGHKGRVSTGSKEKNTSHGYLSKFFNIRLEELKIRSMILLYEMDTPTLAILYEDSHKITQIKTYYIAVKEKKITDAPWSLKNVDPSANHMIAILYYKDLINNSSTILFKYSISHNGISRIDDDGTRYLIGDGCGTLHLLVLPDSEKIYYYDIGKISEPTSITYLDEGYAFIGSHFGDSQLVKLRKEYNSSNELMDLLENYVNLAPLHDFCVINLERQGLGQLITCSGGNEDGTLRIIRNGIGVTEQASMNILGINGVWSLRPTFDSSHDDTIVISLATETRILKLNQGEELTELEEYSGFNLSKTTKSVKNVIGNRIVQITETNIALFVIETGELLSEWLTENGKTITVADVNTTQIVIGLSGGTIIYFEIKNDKLMLIKKLELDSDISCLSINPLEDPTSSSIVAVGLWKVIGIKILKLPTLDIISDEKFDGTSITRSVLLTNFENNHYVLAASGDGQLYHFLLNPTTGELSEKKHLSLGTQPIILIPFISNGKNHVFAASDRPTIIYSDNNKLLYSSVNTKDVTYMCPFRPDSESTSLVITHEDGLTIGTIDEIQKLHIRTISLNEMPRRIAHQESTNTIGLLTAKTTTRFFTGEKTTEPYFKIMDDQTLEISDTFKLRDDELVHYLSTGKLDMKESSPEFYFVGTTLLSGDGDNNNDGRLLIFQVEGEDNNRKIRLFYEKVMKGSVFCCIPFNGKLLVSVNSKVSLFNLQEDNSGRSNIIPMCSYSCLTLALYVVTRGHFILVADLFRSITVLMYKELNKDNKKLELIARDLNAKWLTAVETLDDDDYLACDSNGNMFILERNSDEAEDSARDKLHQSGLYHLGDSINKLRHGSLAINRPDSDLTVDTDILFCTVSGSLGVVSRLTEEKFNYLKKLEKALESYTSSIGGLSNEAWRAFRSIDGKMQESRNFIDGDFIESILDLSHKQQAEIAAICEVKHDEMIKIVEELTRLH